MWEGIDLGKKRKKKCADNGKKEKRAKFNRKKSLEKKIHEDRLKER